MKITLVQTPIVWGQKAENLRIIKKKIEKLARQTDLVVLPELFSTGFIIDRPELSETMSGATVEMLMNMAEEGDFAITGSFLCAENGKTYNRAFFILPSGKIFTADKRHTFTLAHEEKYIERGNKKLTVNYKGFNIRILVCYDIRFPVWARNVDGEYDILIYVANFPDKRIEAWDALLPARAIENQAFVCGVNRIGADGNGFTHAGHSQLIDYKGKRLLNFAEHEENEKTFEIEIEPLNTFREKFPFWKDADDFRITN